MAVSKGKRFKVLTRDRFTCRYCGRRAPDVVLHVDHVHPQSRGGPDSLDNLVTACRDCNSGKGARLLPAGKSPEFRHLYAEQTFPHVDVCHACRSSKGHEAEREEPRPPDGYVAFYTCDKGHSWRTYWARECRMTGRELRQSALDDMISAEAGRR